MAKNVYIHIPFCKSKCKYCSFISFTNTEKKLGYIYSLLKEIDTNYNKDNILDMKLLYVGITRALHNLDILYKESKQELYK